jgi:hypothetical protein
MEPDSTPLILRSTVQPAQNDPERIVPPYTTEIISGQRYRFAVTGTVSAGDHQPGGRHICDGASIRVTGDDSGAVHYLNPADPALTAVRAHPQDWPVQEGDVWEGKDGSQWFARRRPGGHGVLELVSSTGDGMPAFSNMAREMTLAHRRKENPQ